MTTLHYDIKGMSCGGCAKSIERRLGNIAGVHSVAADFAAGGAEVTFDEGATNAAAITEAIESLGFEVTGTCAS